MSGHHSPASLFLEQLDELNAQLPAVREARDDAIHDARVATRRLREILPLLRASGPEGERAQRWLKKTGRRLGRVRDLDVMLELALGTINRLPAAAVALQHLLLELRRTRDASLRRGIKQLERNGGGRILAPLGRVRNGPWRRAAELAIGAAWTGILAARIVERVRELREAVDHAGGVYFPNRVHAVRIAAKKLRYTLEVGHDTGLTSTPGAIRRLKHVQDILGDLQDRHVFLKAADERAAEAGPEHAAAFDAVRAHVETESRDLHRRYLEERADLLELCESACAVRRGPIAVALAARRPALLAAAGALALPPAVRMLRRTG